MKNMSSLIFKQRPWQVDRKIRGSDKKQEEGRAFTSAATFSSLSFTLPPTSTSFSTPLMRLLIVVVGVTNDTDMNNMLISPAVT